MKQQSASVSSNHTDEQTRTILIIDDNGQLRSWLARCILSSCHNHGKSCAIYRIGERNEPSLNYYNNPLNPEETTPTQLPDFIVFEAGTPRQALRWITESRVQYLTIVSDVMMPVDTEVGLPGLLTALSQLQIGINLVFMSSEAQNIEHIQNMLNGQPAYFLIKGSDAWNRLPEALVRGASKFTYRPVVKREYNSAAIFQPATPLPGQEIARPPAFETSRGLVTTPTLGGKYVTTRRQAQVAGSDPDDGDSDEGKENGFWGRVRSFFKK